MDGSIWISIDNASHSFFLRFTILIVQQTSAEDNKVKLFTSGKVSSRNHVLVKQASYRFLPLLRLLFYYNIPEVMVWDLPYLILAVKRSGNSFSFYK